VLVLNRTLVGSLVVTTLFSTLGGLILQNRYQGYTTPTRAALIFSAEPVFASVCSWIVLREVLSPVSMVGALLILSAVLVTELRGTGHGPLPEME
jgi:drug/metabolite transporter (DMT)-like permease